MRPPAVPPGSIWNIIYPNGLWVARDYTARGQFSTEWEKSTGDWRTAIHYNYYADGKVEHQDYGNGMRTGFDYDDRGYTRIVNHYFAPWGWYNYSWRYYWRDERDRIVAWQKSTANGANPTEDGRGNRYFYGAEGQLTDAYYGAADPAGNVNSWQRQDHFNYDAMGNRRAWDYVQSKSWLGWMNFTRKDNGLNQYRAWWNYSIINYDDDIGPPWGSPGGANGVIMQDGWVTAGYNALNQPMYVWSANVGWTYFGYDGLGRCVKRWADNGSVSYLYYDGSDLIQEGSQSYIADRQYVHGARTDEVVAQITPSNNWIRYFHYDANGNCTLQTDGGGGIVEQYDYDAFGFPYFYDAWGNNIGYSPWGNRMLFTGREWLSSLKLYDYRARLYNPELGRFMQPDPKHFLAGDYNLYRYCHNDPVNRSDPTGLWPTDIHNQIIDKALKDKLSDSERKILKDESKKVDRDQSTAGAFKHGMRAPGQSVENARAAHQNYISSNLKEAIKQQNAGNRTGALQALGRGIHALTDGTSPAHAGYQVWNGLPNPLTQSAPLAGALAAAALAHVAQESAITSTQLSGAATLVNDYYESFVSGSSH